MTNWIQNRKLNVLETCNTGYVLEVKVNVKEAKIPNLFNKHKCINALT